MLAYLGTEVVHLVSDEDFKAVPASFLQTLYADEFNGANIVNKHVAPVFLQLFDQAAKEWDDDPSVNLTLGPNRNERILPLRFPALNALIHLSKKNTTMNSRLNSSFWLRDKMLMPLDELERVQAGRENQFYMDIMSRISNQKFLARLQDAGEYEFAENLETSIFELQDFFLFSSYVPEGYESFLVWRNMINEFNIAKHYSNLIRADQLPEKQ